MRSSGDHHERAVVAHVELESERADVAPDVEHLLMPAVFLRSGEQRAKGSTGRDEVGHEKRAGHVHCGVKVMRPSITVQLDDGVVRQNVRCQGVACSRRPVGRDTTSFCTWLRLHDQAVQFEMMRH